MKTWGILVLSGFVLSGCIGFGQPTDPRSPIDEARKEITDIRAFQLQAERLRPLQEDLERVLLADARVQSASAGIFFGSSGGGNEGARLVVGFVLLVELKKDKLPTTQPVDQDRCFHDTLHDIVREALSKCGWEVERLDSDIYEYQARVRGEVRGKGKSPAAGAGLDLLPIRSP